MISDASFNENSPANLDESQGDAATLHMVDRPGKQKVKLYNKLFFLVSLEIEFYFWRLEG